MEPSAPAATIDEPRPGAAPVPLVRLLDPHTVNQIAAGEVVERPASVLKELVENALDAGARRIEIVLEDCGRRLVSVADDGSGMGEEDARAALQRHATSKIRAAEDLAKVATLGFRGEAIPSIASVSRLTLRTAERDGSRFAIQVEDGRVAREWREPGPTGTRVDVEDLFLNTPARLKFLKSDATELGACLETVRHYAVAYPEVAFTLRTEAGVALSTSGSGDLRAAVAEVWGIDLARGLAEIDAAGEGVRVRGFVSPPHLTRPTRAYQWAFVNRRPVRSKTLVAALDAAYRELTPDRRYPVALLMLDVDPGRIDVNVSPTKQEVKFQSEGQAFDAVRRGVREGLMANGMIPTAEAIAAANAALREAAPGPSALALAWQAQAPLFAETPLGTQPEPRRYQAGELLEGLRVIGQMDATFILAENDRGLLIVDQHVAHERILFERLRSARGGAGVERQRLLEPLSLEVDRRAADALRERLDVVEQAGFSLEPFGVQSFLVREAPAVLKGRDPRDVLRDLADELAEGRDDRRDVREALWTMCACKMAIKAGDPLLPAEMERLLVDLAQTENPYLCPHGRPITIVLERGDLMRKFKR